MSFKSLLLCVFLLPTFCFGQDVNFEQILEDITETSADRSDLDRVSIIEQLHYLHQYPLDINLATFDDFNKLSFLSPFQINAILQLRNETGEIIDLLELQTLDEFDYKTYVKIAQFVEVKTSNSSIKQWGKALKVRSQDLLFRLSNPLEKSKGFLLPDSSSSKFKGQNYATYLRYRMYFENNLQFGANISKKIGETYKNTLSLASIGIFAKDVNKHLVKVAIGSYALQYGQGLSLWSGFALYKNPDVFSIAKRGEGLKFYLPNSRVNSLNGIASTIALGKNFQLTPFFSYRKYDSTIDSTLGGFTSISTAGLFRNSPELAKKQNLSQSVYGLSGQYDFHNLNVGFTSHFIHWGTPAVIDPNDVYKRYEFEGKSVGTVSIYHNYLFKNFYFFGEFAQNINSGSAFLQGLLVSLSPRFSLVSLYRNYGASYHAFLANPLAESTGISNERGIYIGAHIKLHPQVELRLFSDSFSFPWLKYNINTPSDGKEHFAQLSYTHSSAFNFYFRYRLKQGAVSDPNSNTKGVLQSLKHSYRLESNFTLSKKLSVSNRLEIVESLIENNNSTKGYLFMQDIDYKQIIPKLNAGVRLAIFDVQSYDSRIYALEKSVLYDYEMAMFQDQGVRFYLNLQYKFVKQMDFWLRYAITAYNNKTNIGSGNDIIDGSENSKIVTQFRYIF